MRAVIFAAAMLAGASGWLLLQTDAPTPPPAAAALAPAKDASARNQYRADRARCKLNEAAERSLCERHARERVHARLRQEAAKISFR